jgi:hypothetical protein
MAFVIADRVRETTSTSGTGTLTLGGPFSGFQGFSVIGDGNNTYYAISDPNTGSWEVGVGTYTASGNTLSRDTVLASSNSGSLVVFGPGTKDVICTQPAERNVYVVGSNVVAANSATVPNTLLANSSITINGNTVALGGTTTITANTTETLTRGTYLTGNNFNGSAATTWAVDADTANTAGKVVVRDGSGNFAAGTITATRFSGPLTGIVGDVSPAAGTFTTVNANTSLTTPSATITGGTINGTSVGATTASTGAFTSLTASLDSSFTSAGALTIPVGTTAERPTGAVGKVRWNTTLNQYEGYDGTNWTLLGGAVITNDTTTSTNLYPTFAGVTSGNVSTLFTGNAKLLYKPSTGELQSTALVASNGLVVNSATVSENYTIPTGSNAMSSGPVTVNGGVSVTIPSGSRWVVL